MWIAEGEERDDDKKGGDDAGNDSEAKGDCKDLGGDTPLSSLLMFAHLHHVCTSKVQNDNPAICEASGNPLVNDEKLLSLNSSLHRFSGTEKKSVALKSPRCLCVCFQNQCKQN